MSKRLSSCSLQIGKKGSVDWKHKTTGWDQRRRRIISWTKTGIVTVVRNKVFLYFYQYSLGKEVFKKNEIYLVLWLHNKKKKVSTF